jgi:hypothetical protein
MLHNNPAFPPTKFNCEKCDYHCNNKKDFNRHLFTTKHKKRHKWYKNDGKLKMWSCAICAKRYSHHSSYYRHIKIHKKENMKVSYISGVSDAVKVPEKDPEKDPEKEAMKAENRELRKMMMNLIATTREMAPKVGNNNVSINVFLNKTCKDAMNLTDFVARIRVTLEDLMKTREMGYVGGLSNIFIKNLEDLPSTERPFHCSDIKRLKFYVKNENKWDKDEDNKMGRAIHEVAVKQIEKIKDWEKAHPNYLEDDRLLHEWQTLIRNTMGDLTAAEREKDIKKNVGVNVILKDAIDKV